MATGLAPARTRLTCVIQKLSLSGSVTGLTRTFRSRISLSGIFGADRRVDEVISRSNALIVVRGMRCRVGVQLVQVCAQSHNDYKDWTADRAVLCRV